MGSEEAEAVAELSLKIMGMQLATRIVNEFIDNSSLQLKEELQRKFFEMLPKHMEHC